MYMIYLYNIIYTYIYIYIYIHIYIYIYTTFYRIKFLSKKFPRKACTRHLSHIGGRAQGCIRVLLESSLMQHLAPRKVVNILARLAPRKAPHKATLEQNAVRIRLRTRFRIRVRTSRANLAPHKATLRRTRDFFP